MYFQSMNFFTYLGIFLLFFFLIYLLFNLFLNKKWQFIIGLTSEIDYQPNEFLSNIGNKIKPLKPSSKSTANWIAGIFAFFSTILLIQQNDLIRNQNAKIEIQSNLLEADRRNAVYLLMDNLFSKIEKEINIQKNIGVKQFELSQETIAQIATQCLAFKPYKYYDQDTLTTLRSPERGQLFVYLFKLNLSNKTKSDILSNCDFTFMEIKNQKIVGLNSDFIQLENIHFENVVILDSEIFSLRLKNCYFQCNIGNSDIFRLFFEDCHINTHYSNDKAKGLRQVIALNSTIHFLQIDGIEGDSEISLHNSNITWLIAKENYSMRLHIVVSKKCHGLLISKCRGSLRSNCLVEKFFCSKSSILIKRISSKGNNKPPLFIDSKFCNSILIDRNDVLKKENVHIDSSSYKVLSNYCERDSLIKYNHINPISTFLEILQEKYWLEGGNLIKHVNLIPKNNLSLLCSFDRNFNKYFRSYSNIEGNLTIY